MVMIPMECPKCGRRGSVPSNRINTSFKCKSCNAPFYMNGKGDAVLGEAPIDPETARRRDADKKKKQQKEVEFSFDLGSLVRGQSPALRMRLLLIVAGVSAALLAVVLYFRMPSVDPLVERGQYVANAVVDNDTVRLKAVSTPETGEDTLLWLDKVRSLLGIKGAARDYKATASIMEGSSSGSYAVVIASLVPLAGTEGSAETVQDPRATKFETISAAPKTSASSTAMLSMTLYFVKDSQGTWRVDGRQTLTAVEPRKTNPKASGTPAK
ncbi:MAG TPA: hypothetical protein VGZ22_03920 [Isosphaeraceae bacterium]|jgi:hypothetical protein|nr:hypothetical protein [Isosphaeraceae bacterium]